MNVSPTATILNHLRSKYHNCPLYIVHCPFGQLPDKLEFVSLRFVIYDKKPFKTHGFGVAFCALFHYNEIILNEEAVKRGRIDRGSVR